MSQNNETMKEMGLVYSNLQDAAYFYNKGIEAFRLQNLIKAQQYLERAVSLDPKEPAFYCQLAIILADLGDLHRSNDCLIKIVDEHLADEMPECHFFLANNYANLGLFEHARKEALLYLDKDPDGEFLEDTEDLLELLQEEDDLFAEAETMLIRYELAAHELKKQNYDKAILYFNDLLKENPEYWMAHIRLAEAYYLKGNSNKAIDILNSVLQKEDNVVARGYLMTYLYETDEKAKATLIADSLKNVWSIDDEHCYSLAISFGKIGEHNRALDGFERLQRRGFGDFPKFHYHVAVAYFYTGKIEKAVAIWEKLANLGNNDALANLQFLQEGNHLKPTYNYRA
ncbi:tetratricopeptide repeat protein [Anaerobacillus sp. CMMVII]|uniref:tetratricopeptide repeat protein n=1 Tax=Anaerobacillus sp. CMMVII TaxID=2755588 RepID=UPI0021B75D19|nr:tetratricopeptide repeat protein [Anaerobacillus sp. CMMVII]MCT8140206.1 tetratricopeptide repeat protein [Anaerobacillus sp. CMMVII]